MDQIPSTDNDKVNDECSLQNNSSVNPSEGNNLENFSNPVGNEVASGCGNDENESSEKPCDSLLETKSGTDENDVSSTSYAENEISNENDPVVDQHSRCETFEKDDDSGCTEMEAEYTSQPKVDVTDSNVNNLLPSVSNQEPPSASDYIALPPASDHTLPASDRIEVSAVSTDLPSDHIHQSSASDHIEQPPALDHIEQPSASDHIEQPPASDHIEQPSASDHIEQPPASDHIEQPSASDHIEQPPASDHIEQPSASDHIEQPPASDHIEQPSESDYIEQPSASDNIEQSSASNHIEQPSASDHIEQPSEPDHIEQPSASDHIEQPSASDHIEQPSASDHIEQPSASDHIEQPSASDHIEQPSASDHIEQSSPRDCIEPPSASDCTESSLVSSSPPDCSTLRSAVANTNTDCGPDTVYSGTETDPISEAVSNAEAGHNTENISIAENSCSAEVVTNAESSPNTVVADAVTNAGTEAETNSAASPTTDTLTNAEASPDIKVIANVQGGPDSEVTNTETSLKTEVANPEASPSTKIVANAEASCTEAVSNPDSSPQPNENACDVKVRTVDDSTNKETNPVDDETVDGANNFLPTIVAIRGGCTDVLEKTSDPSSSNSLHEDVDSSKPPEMPSLNIVSVLGGCKDLDSDSEIGKVNVVNDSSQTPNQMVPTISNSEETDPNNHPMCTSNEPGSTSMTSECPIKEDKPTNIKVEDPEVICIETTTEIPPPIPIKVESNIESLNVEAEESRSFSKNGKFTAKKRLTRSSLSQSDDCVFLSSSSDVDSVSDSKKRNRSSKNVAYSTAGYTCHLCNTVFQEHELLNEHMILHRNNSLIEAKVQNRSKTSRVKTYSCNVCQKQLSTGQSLQQHVLIHKNEKPFVCGICKKDFRHLHNYRTHQQKHKEEQQCAGKTQQTGVKEQLDKSVVRGVDFGRLVGPLFMKESLYHQEKDTGSSKNQPPKVTDLNKQTAFGYYTKGSTSHQPRLSFDQPPFKTNSSASPVIIRRREPSPDSSSEDECVAVKSFSNIESVVMNAAKIIVRLDNLDTSVLKRKLQTPDISIDQAPKRCRVMLSPIAEKCNVKLDEIENIPMDVDVGDINLQAAEQMDDDREDYPNEGTEETSDTGTRPLGTPTYKEVFDLLNNDSTSTDVNDHGHNNRNQIMKQDHCKIDDSVKNSVVIASPPHKPSNVIFVEAPPSREMYTYEDEETVDNRLDDAFDTAFQKVAVRRLALLRKRATENGGKVESRYLLGPLFWRKALKRARRQTNDAAINVDVALSGSKNGTRAAALRTRASQFGGRSKFDNRRTNDPTKLQMRAERKFKYLLELAKMLDNLNSLNLSGPLFWRRTLRLAGVRRGEDLRMHVNIASPTLDGIEFVDDGGQLCDFNATVPINAEKTSPSRSSDPAQPSPSDQVQPSPSNLAEASTSNAVQPLPADSVRSSPCVQPSVSEVSAIRTSISESDGQRSDQQTARVSKLVDKIPVTQLEPSGYQVAAENASNEVASHKTDSILYESLTKQKEKQQSTVAEGVPPSYLDSTNLYVASQGTAVESAFASHSKTVVVEGCTNDQSNQCPQLSGDVADVTKLATIDSGSIVLNVDNGGGLQLIPANDQIPMAGAGQNFVLLSDGSGAMQYMVNVPHENFGNFELIGNAVGGDQVAYAIQLNGENYVQFVQDGGIQLQGERGLKEAQMVVDSKATYLVPDAAVADPNHIGRELSDFLNLDYDNLLKNGSADQPVA